MRRLPLTILICLLLSSFRTNAPLTLPREPAAPRFEAPSDPSVKDVGLLTGRAPDGDPYEAQAVFCGGRTNACTLYLTKREIVFFFEKDGSQYKRQTAVSTISAVQFLKWKGFPQEDKSTWIFYPVLSRITLKDGLSFECGYYIEEFGKPVCVDRVGQTSLYAYYYDYRENGTWKNCRKKEKAWPETHQPARVLKALRFK